MARIQRFAKRKEKMLYLCGARRFANIFIVKTWDAHVYKLFK